MEPLDWVDALRDESAYRVSPFIFGDSGTCVGKAVNNQEEIGLEFSCCHLLLYLL